MGKTRKLLRRCLVVAAMLAVAIPTVAWGVGSEPTTVPVFYEPARSDFEKQRGPAPSRYDHGGFWETETTALDPPVWSYDDVLDRNRLPDGYILPLPKPPGRAAVYQSLVTAKRQYTKEVTIRSWRWAVSSKCDNVTTDKWNDEIDCSALEAKLKSEGYRDDVRLTLGRRSYSNLDYIAELHYGVVWSRPDSEKIDVWNKRYVPETVSQARKPGGSRHIVDSTGNPLLDDNNPMDRPPAYACPTEDDPDRECQLQPSDTDEHLEADGLGDDMVTHYRGIIDDYTIFEVVDKADYAAAKTQWRADSDLIMDHNRTVRANHQPTVTRTYVCNDTCEANFQKALTEWNAINPFNAAAYAEARNQYASRESQTGMYVDCKLDRCEVVNPVRP